jgi:hypothetical protein
MDAEEKENRKVLEEKRALLEKLKQEVFIYTIAKFNS